nr:hypothetical protein Iba_chr14dCG18070 [Ipomoea batatas]
MERERGLINESRLKGSQEPCQNHNFIQRNTKTTSNPFTIIPSSHSFSPFLFLIFVPFNVHKSTAFNLKQKYKMTTKKHHGKRDTVLTKNSPFSQKQKKTTS